MSTIYRCLDVSSYSLRLTKNETEILKGLNKQYCRC